MTRILAISLIVLMSLALPVAVLAQAGPEPYLLRNSRLGEPTRDQWIISSSSWVVSRHRVELTGGRAGTPAFQGLANNLDGQGLELNVGASIPLFTGLNLLAQGGWLIPGPLNSAETIVVSTGLPHHYRTDTTRERWNLRLTAWYELPGQVRVGVGCRFDKDKNHLYHTLADTGLANNTKKDVDLSIYEPFVGIETGFSTANTSLSVQVVGSPWCFGRMMYNRQALAANTFSATGNCDFDEGYWLGIGGSYDWKVFDDLAIGVSVSGRSVYASGDISLKYSHVGGGFSDSLNYSGTWRYTEGKAGLRIVFETPSLGASRARAYQEAAMGLLRGWAQQDRSRREWVDMEDLLRE